MISKRVVNLRRNMREEKPHICIERARLITEFYSKCSSDTTMIRRAKLLDYLLENMTIYISDEELFVGNNAKSYRGVPVFPEYGANWILDTIDEFSTRKTDPLYIDDDNKKELRMIMENWKDNSFKELVDERLDPKVLEAEQLGVLSVGSRTTSTGHVVPNYPKVFKMGLKGIMQEAQDKIDSVGLVDHNIQRQIEFWEGVIIEGKACIKFAHRYADLARDLALQEKNPKRKEELLRIEKTCRHVPEYPPRDTYEALQFFWFMHLIMQIENNGHSIGLGRFDQTIYPYYEKDMEEDKITFDEAVEMISCLWIKITEIIKVRDAFDAQAFAGYPMWQNCVIAGVDKNGRDATNEFTMIILQATSEVQTTQPTVSFRYHDNIDREAFNKALSMMQAGLATPAMFNDKLIIPLVLAKGATIEEARDWSIEGCVENYVSGKTDGRPVVGYINTTKLLEFVLNNGVDPISGKLVGLQTGNPVEFKNFDEFMGAYHKQMEYFTKMMCEAYNIVGACHATMAPSIISSALVDDCIEKGLSLQEGGAKYNFSGSFITALANTADSLAAIKKFVYEEKEVDINALVNVLENNFEDEEALRLMLLNEAPKYGNDDDYVDDLASEIVSIAVEEIDKYTDSRRGRYVLSVLSQSFNVLQGKSVGATPDGRKAYEPLADNASPVASRDVSGPTAALRSVSKIDQFKPLIGTLLNQKFDPDIVEGEKGLELLGYVIESYFDEYGEHIQINVVDEETLRDAQKNPDRHRNLMVRVAGYSAYFIELDSEVQENIIARKAQRGL